MKRTVLATLAILVVCAGLSVAAKKLKVIDIWVLTFGSESIPIQVGDAYATEAAAEHAAKTFTTTDPHVWVQVSGTQLFGKLKNRGDREWSLLDWFIATPSAQALLTTSALILPETVRGGIFTSASTTLPDSFSAAGVALDIPAAQLALPYGVMAWIEETPDGGVSWQLVAGIGDHGPNTSPANVFAGRGAFHNFPVRANVVTCYQTPIPVNNGLVTCTPVPIDVGLSISYLN